MSRTVYFVSGSPFAWRVMLALGLKGLDYQAKRLVFDEGDTQKPEYLALNPRGKVPTLVDGEVTVYESLAILAFLDRAYPDVPLLGETPADAALVWRRALEIDNYLASALTGAARPIFTQTFAGKEAEINENFAKVRAEIENTAGWLDGNDFMAGSAPTAVDVSLYPPLAMLRRVGPQLAGVPGIEANLPDFETDLPELAAWMKRVEALPGFDAAYPPHWREAA
ncbi:MAG: glutathione S-transferase family protein [Kordiimonadaceae bacterium]|nr:glutathione S-transferase family protein [Kordiimonadaceae bacterium]MBO6568542.1 glutathione S-transferase family protein [Kordiimonadaceae bacterium]MBO6963729.1 glutathione S-transferase family protein [Kordiimonadaceae bacterium]